MFAHAAVWRNGLGGPPSASPTRGDFVVTSLLARPIVGLPAPPTSAARCASALLTRRERTPRLRSGARTGGLAETVAQLGQGLVERDGRGPAPTARPIRTYLTRPGREVVVPDRYKP